MPKAYIIADVTVTDAAQMAKYREWSSQAMQEHGANILVRGGEFEVLEGPWTPSRLIVLEFANRDTAKAFYNSQTYQHAITLRQGAGIMRMVCVDGVA
jgi:uncharacterized protein (DUF1330 family)